MHNHTNTENVFCLIKYGITCNRSIKIYVLGRLLENRFCFGAANRMKLILSRGDDGYGDVGDGAWMKIAATIANKAHS